MYNCSLEIIEFGFGITSTSFSTFLVLLQLEKTFSLAKRHTVPLSASRPVETELYNMDGTQNTYSRRKKGCSILILISPTNDDLEDDL